MGVPWGRLPLGQAELEIMLQSSSLFGSYFITFLLLTVNGILAYILLEPSRRLFAAITATALFVSNLAIGGICLLSYEDEGEPLTVAIIQGNVSSHDPWAQGSLDQAKEVYRKYSLEAAKEGAELIIWPETAFPYNIDRYYDLEIYICNLARECDATILASVFTENEERNPLKLYNSMIAVDNHGMINETVYSKRNLVPFGEFVPWRGIIMRLIPPLAELGMLEEDLLIGKESYVFDLDGKLEGVKVGSLICFDSIYEQNSLESVANGAQLLSVSTNDSWFLDSAAAYMHNEQSCLRAIETGRYVVRAANTGVSTVITPTGEVTELLEPLVEGYIMGEVYLSDRTTLYSSIGDVFVYLCTAFVAAALLLRPITYLKSRKKQFTQ
jgi:apolipoprotein N-acyltransferase